MYISNEIGSAYEHWKGGDCIFISSHTGSGKTHFILKTLLPFFAENNMRILYLVNRHILKEQLEGEIKNVSSEYAENIMIETYQTIEACIVNNEDSDQTGRQNYGFNGMKRYMENVCVVCDECHYFLADSNYNTNTALSFRFVQEKFLSKIRIFISATISDIMSYIVQDTTKRLYGRTFYYSFSPNPKYGEYVANEHMFEYNLNEKYENIEPHILSDISMIVDIMRKNKGKWLIFVDSINLGKQLEAELNMELKKEMEEKLAEEIYQQENMRKERGKRDVQKIVKIIEGRDKVKLLTSNYRKDEEADGEVRKITKEQKQEAQVLISTSVMDNGISLKDIELRNVILFADTEVEFMQMLGRKRMDEKPLSLYIYRLNRDHFVKRKRYVEKLLEIARGYMKDFEERIVAEPKDKYSFLHSQIDWNEYDKLESKYIKEQHISIMRDIARNRKRYEYVSQLFSVYGGVFYLNKLAASHVEDLNSYYQKVIDRFDVEGENAFLREQLSWLGIGKEMADRIINEELEETEVRINGLFEELVEKSPIGGEDFKKFKENVKGDLLRLLKNVEERDEEWDTVYNSLRRNDRVISDNVMDYLRCNCNIPFIVKSNRDATYTVKRSEEKSDNKDKK